jgi:hypothetical protein
MPMLLYEHLGIPEESKSILRITLQDLKEISAGILQVANEPQQQRSP